MPTALAARVLRLRAPRPRASGPRRLASAVHVHPRRAGL